MMRTRYRFGLCVLLLWTCLLFSACGPVSEEEAELPETEYEEPIPEPPEESPPPETIEALEGYTVVELFHGGELRGYAYADEEGCFLDPLLFLGDKAELRLEENGFLLSCGEELQLSGDFGKSYVSANGRYLFTPRGVLLSGDRVYLPEDAVEKMFQLKLRYDRKAGRISWDQDSVRPLKGGPDYYQVEFSVDDLYWLSHIIMAEAGNQQIEGMIGVGNVVMNRVEHPDYPDTIFKVIFDFQNAPQFSPRASTGLQQPVSEEAMIAACLCLEGYRTAGDCLYFQNPYGIESNWMTFNREYALSIGNLDFYH